MRMVSGMGNGRSFIAGILFVIAIVAIAAGVMYVVTPAHSLPSFFPGHIAGSLAKHTKRGYIGIGVGVVLFIVAVVLVSTGRRRRSFRRY
jgi:amino acid permease